MRHDRILGTSQNELVYIYSNKDLFLRKVLLETVFDDFAIVMIM